MGRKSRFTINEKLEAIQCCTSGRASVNHKAELLGVSCKSLTEWINNYQSLGIKGLTRSKKNTLYTTSLKENAVYSRWFHQNAIKASLLEDCLYCM